MINVRESKYSVNLTQQQTSPGSSMLMLNDIISATQKSLLGIVKALNSQFTVLVNDQEFISQSRVSKFTGLFSRQIFTDLF